MIWIGGKKALREVIVSHFPADYSRYVEVFGGAGWVLFQKPPGNDFEIYNDCNRQLANLYRWVQEEPEALIRELTYSLNSRADFERIRTLLAGDAEAGSVKQATWFYRQMRKPFLSDQEDCDEYTPDENEQDMDENDPFYFPEEMRL